MRAPTASFRPGPRRARSSSMSTSSRNPSCNRFQRIEENHESQSSCSYNSGVLFCPGHSNLSTNRSPGIFGSGSRSNIASPRAGLDVRGLEKSTTDKAKIIQTLHESFAHIRGAVLSLSDADVDKKLKLFGQDTTDRGAMIFMLRHLGEHLGQSIAYARINNVVPPWTEEQQRRQQQQQQKPPEKPKQ